jgi:hypothetical protein
MYLIVPKTKEKGIVIRSEGRSFLTRANNIFINGLLLSIAVTRCPKALDTLEDPPILEDLPIIEDPHWKNNAKDILEDPSHRWFFNLFIAYIFIALYNKDTLFCKIFFYN